jgi:hypothetical protein
VEEHHQRTLELYEDLVAAAGQMQALLEDPQFLTKATLEVLPPQRKKAPVVVVELERLEEANHQHQV